jgi:hypothetical protein
MQAIFPVVLFGSIALFVVIGAASMLTRNNLYDQIGQGGLTTDSLGSGARPMPEPGAERAERDSEIRQMLQARSDRLVRQGQPPLDIEAELSRLDAPDLAGGGYRDNSLAEEVRQLVVARNERRRRQGQPALDVESEIARTLTELDA